MGCAYFERPNTHPSQPITPPLDIHFIYFDLDDTLLDHKRAERRALGDVYARYQPHFGALTLADLQDRYHTVNIDMWTRYAAGTLTKADVKHQRFARLLDACQITGLDADAVNTTYLVQYSQHWSFCQGAEAAFHALADRYPVGILTNGFSEIQHAKLAQFSDLRARIQALIISDEVGYMKPHPHLFTHAEAQADTPPQHILYIGDSYTSDVQGASRAGWHMAWYRGDDDRATAANVFAFNTWPDLLDWLSDG